MKQWVVYCDYFRVDSPASRSALSLKLLTQAVTKQYFCWSIMFFATGG